MYPVQPSNRPNNKNHQTVPHHHNHHLYNPDSHSPPQSPPRQLCHPSALCLLNSRPPPFSTTAAQQPRSQSLTKHPNVQELLRMHIWMDQQSGRLQHVLEFRPLRLAITATNGMGECDERRRTTSEGQFPMFAGR